MIDWNKWFIGGVVVFVVDLIQSVVVVEPIFCNQRPPGSVIISGGMCVQCRGM